MYMLGKSEKKTKKKKKRNENAIKKLLLVAERKLEKIKTSYHNGKGT